MRKLHIIDGDDMHYRHEEKYMYDPELRDAYECGYRKAYKEIMSEQYGGYGERGNYPRHGGINYRDDERWDDSEYEERRRRRANGRFY